jgi:hypothetical protein
MNNNKKQKKDIAIAVTGNFKYLYKYFNNIYSDIRKKGMYSGDILIITTLMCPTFLIKSISKKNNVIVLRFHKIKFDENTIEKLSNLKTYPDPNRHKTKEFQWHKLNLFDEKLKKWKYIFYLDINMNIHHNLNLILRKLPENSLMARADAYPEYKRTLESQFDNTNPIFIDLSTKYDLNINNYFQTGVLFFDTNIIEKNTKNYLINLVKQFPISKTNEQGIMNLFFIFEKNIYKELPLEVENFLTYFYWKMPDKKVIITKANTVQNK